MVRKRKAKIKNISRSSEKNNKNKNDELMDDSIQSNDSEKPTVKVECEESTAETSTFFNETVKFSCTVSIKKRILRLNFSIE